MFAHLPMYNVPSTAQRMCDCGRRFRTSCPRHQIWHRPPGDLIADWLSPNLFLSQTCGLPFRAKLHGLVQLVATPDNQIPNCAAGYYHSVILARQGSDPDLATNDFVLAYNEPLSQSGWAAPQSIGITGVSRVQTGGHAASALAVMDGDCRCGRHRCAQLAFSVTRLGQSLQSDGFNHDPHNPNPSLYYSTKPGRERPPARIKSSDSLVGSKRP